LIEALYAGLGIAAPPPAARSAAQMELIGALLRAAVSGTLGLLAARGIAKRELGASQTLIQARQNNPLKFAADVNTALLQLLEPPLRGFIPALPAVRETFDDLAAHEVAILAGMRGALEAVLERFNPATLEQRWADRGMWDNLRPASHKAKMWERFTEQHAEMVREVDDNFDVIFAGAFSAAYEAQLARLKGSG
jgi:type VI secretion system FHA domain protein